MDARSEKASRESILESALLSKPRMKVLMKFTLTAFACREWSWSRSLLTALILTALARAQDLERAPERYSGCREASAAIAIDKEHFVVANDEDNILRIYKIKESKPVASLDLDKELAEDPADEPEKRKVDIEGATRIGDISLWIGSHSRTTEKAKLRPSRFRLFAVAVNPKDIKDIKFIGSSKVLYDQLLAADESLRWGLGLKKASGGRAKDYEIGPKDEGGFNIEGLSVIPKTQGVYIGLRNPLCKTRQPRGEAILIPLLNPVDLITGKTKVASFDKPVLLDLGGRGVRSLEWREESKSYWIVAGPCGLDSKPGFALYQWSGRGEERPSPLKKIRFEKDFHPEALVVHPGTIWLQLLSDQGSLSKKDEAPESKNSFLSRWIKLD